MIIEGIFITLGIILAIGGLCESIHAIKLIGIMNSKRNPMVSLLVLKPKEWVFQLDFAAEQQNWLGEDFAKYVIAVTDSIEPEEIESCRQLANEKNIILCKTSELPQWVSKVG